MPMNTLQFAAVYSEPVTPSNAVNVARQLVKDGKTPSPPLQLDGDGFSVLYDGTAYRLELSPSFIVAGLAKAGVDSAKRLLSGKHVLVTEELAATRLRICNGCQSFDQAASKCTNCGCYMPAKAKLAASTCPLDKWPVDQAL